MKLAFSLFKYFPYGGLQRDFMAVARACQSRGHEITVFVMEWHGEIPDGFSVRELKARSISNHGKCIKYAKQLKLALEKERFDAVIGFNKVPGLDIYFAADNCFVERHQKKNRWSACGSFRYKAYAALERSVFSSDGVKTILVLTEQQKKSFIEYYKTSSDRFFLLPPNVDPQCVVLPESKLVAAELRDKFFVAKTDLMLLMVASDFKTKGLDRCLKAIANLPKDIKSRVHFFVIGDGKRERYQEMIRKLGIESRVIFLGPRDDVAQFYVASDLLIHPAYNETAGKVLVEALACGLPVITTENCGYASHIANAGAGIVVQMPFKQQAFDDTLSNMLSDSTRRMKCRESALLYSSSIDLFTMIDSIVDRIELLKS